MLYSNGVDNCRGVLERMQQDWIRYHIDPGKAALECD
jgi:hypothetical protein